MLAYCSEVFLNQRRVGRGDFVDKRFAQDLEERRGGRFCEVASRSFGGSEAGGFGVGGGLGRGYDGG